MVQTYAGYQSQELLDAQYRLEPSVENFPAYVDWYVSESANTRNALEHRRAVKYGPTIAENANIFPARGPQLSPIFIFVHGGYWYSLDADTFDLAARGPVAAGFSVVNVNYALCPTVGIGEIVRQIKAAVAWTWHNAGSFGGDRDRIFIGGHSAGGQLAITSIQTDWEGEYGLPADTIKGSMPISGVFDLEPVSRSYMQPQLRFTCEDVQRYSPMRTIEAMNIPIVTAYGTRETQAFQDQSRSFAAQWTAHGNTGELLPLDRDHFDILAELNDPDGILVDRLRKFIS